MYIIQCLFRVIFHPRLLITRLSHLCCYFENRHGNTFKCDYGVNGEIDFYLYFALQKSGNEI